MEQDLSSAFAFGTYLREHPEAAMVYDGLSPEERQDVLRRLKAVDAGEIAAFARSLTESAWH